MVIDGGAFFTVVKIVDYIQGSGHGSLIYFSYVLKHVYIRGVSEIEEIVLVLN